MALCPEILYIDKLVQKSLQSPVAKITDNRAVVHFQHLFKQKELFNVK